MTREPVSRIRSKSLPYLDSKLVVVYFDIPTLEEASVLAAMIALSADPDESPVLLSVSILGDSDSVSCGLMSSSAVF